MTTMKPEKLAVVQALAELGYVNHRDYRIETRSFGTFVKFNYDRAAEPVIIEHIQQLSIVAAIFFYPNAEKEGYLFISCNIPDERFPAGIYVSASPTYRVTSLEEAAQVAAAYRAHAQKERAARIERKGYDFDFNVEQLELFEGEEEESAES
jgi:hypothetical protein